MFILHGVINGGTMNIISGLKELISQKEKKKKEMVKTQILLDNIYFKIFYLNKKDFPPLGPHSYSVSLQHGTSYLEGWL